MKSPRNLILLFITILLLLVVLQAFPNKAEKSDYLSIAKNFLDTKTTNDNGLGCGPPDDWDCGYTRYQTFAILANSEYYEKTGDPRYLQYAINFANTRPTSPPSYCSTCICSMPNDVDCGNGEDQFEAAYSFAYLYKLTGNRTYLDFAERVAATKPSSPPDWCKDCICGPPDDWDCYLASHQLGYYRVYELLYNLTGNVKYKQYNLLDNFVDKTPEDRGILLLKLYTYAYSSTGNVKYLEIAKQKAIELSSSNFPCGPPDKWQCPSSYKYHQSRLISVYTSLYELTGDQRFLDDAIKFADAGGLDCGPSTGWACVDPVLHASMANAYYRLYRITNDQKYLNYFNNLISPDSLSKINCANFNCHDGEFNYYFALTLTELN